MQAILEMPKSMMHCLLIFASNAKRSETFNLTKACLMQAIFSIYNGMKPCWWQIARDLMQFTNMITDQGALVWVDDIGFSSRPFRETMHITSRGNPCLLQPRKWLSVVVRITQHEVLIFLCHGWGSSFVSYSGNNTSSGLRGSLVN
jgi:hypothetical protein